MRTISQISGSGIWTGLSRTIEPAEPRPAGWVAAEPPDAVPEGLAAMWTGAGWVLAPPPVQVEPLPEPFPALTRRQLRLALLSIGVTAEDVEAQINAITDPVDRAAALIEWEDATHYKRDHPLVADVAAEMQLPPEQVDALWVWAAGI